MAAKGAVWAKIDPEVGTGIQWFTPPGTGQMGVIQAFASTIYDVANVQNGVTGVLSWTVPTEFNGANTPGKPDGSGGIAGVNSGQFPPTFNPAPNMAIKVKLLTLSWLTVDFAEPRFVEFTTKATSGKVYLDVGLAAWVGQKCNLVDGSGGFWVVPTPSGVAILGLGGLLALRRRRG